MIKIAIVDDEQGILDSIHEKLENVLSGLKVDFVIKKFINSKTAMKTIKENNFDVVLLDIDMPEINGMELAEKLRAQMENLEIIFITNKESMVYDAIKFVPFRFIRKAKFNDEIEEALSNLIEKLEINKSIFTFSTLNGKKSIPAVKIWYIEVTSHKLNIYLENEPFIANGNLKDIEELFHSYGFIKIHQSYIANYRYINMIKRKEVMLDNGKLLPLSRSRYEQVKLEYMRFLRKG